MQGVLRVSQDWVPPIRLFHYFKVCAVFPDVTNELLCGCFYGHFAVDDPLDGRGPAHGFVQQLGVQSVGVLPPVHDDVPVACVFEDPLIGLHHRAEAVEHERPELGRCALRGLVVVEGSVGQDKPALLHLQGGHLVAALNLLMKPAWHGNTNMSLPASLAPVVRTNNFTVILDLLQNKEKKKIKKIQYFNRKKKLQPALHC